MCDDVALRDDRAHINQIRSPAISFIRNTTNHKPSQSAIQDIKLVVHFPHHMVLVCVVVVVIMNGTTKNHMGQLDHSPNKKTNLTKPETIKL